MGLFGKKYLIEHPEKYEKNEREVIVLVESAPSGVHHIAAGDKYWKSTSSLIACIDCETDELMELPRYITWNYKEDHNKNAHGIKKHGVYRLKVLFSLPFDAGYAEIPAGRSMFVTSVIKKNVSEPRFEKILEDYKKPVLIEVGNDIKLEFDRENGVFSGCIDWRSEDVDVNLEADDDSDTCEGALEAFNTIISDPAAWERKAKLQAAVEMAENANDWQENREDYKPITEADFAKRITLCCISITNSGDMEFWFDDDDMFYGHSIVVYGNIEDGFTETNMVG